MHRLEQAFEHIVFWKDREEVEGAPGKKSLEDNPAHLHEPAAALVLAALRELHTLLRHKAGAAFTAPAVVLRRLTWQIPGFRAFPKPLPARWSKRVLTRQPQVDESNAREIRARGWSVGYTF